MDSLYKIFYSNQKAHQDAYISRFSSPSAVHLPLQIQQFNHQKTFQAFFFYNHELTSTLEKIYTLFHEFSEILHDTPFIVRKQFSLACLIDEVHSTSSIEGIHSTHKELKDILDGKVHNNHFSSIIKKYDLLMSGLYPLFLSCNDVRTFYDEFAHQDIISENINNKLDGILFRKEAVDIHSASGKIIHRGLSPEDNIIDAMSNALDFLNNDNFAALIRIAVFHYMFVYIHPFYDSNGRTARFISSAYIAKHLHPLIALRLAVTIKKKKSLYYSMLRHTDAECNCGDLTPFICSFLEFISDTIQDINRRLRRKNSQLKRFNTLLSKAVNDNGLKSLILNLLLQASVFYGRGLAINEIISFTGKSRNTIKGKLLTMPVRSFYVPNGRRKFYKIDWTALKYLLNV